ncbi:MarR family transcriptional regulator [Sphingomonas aurantiaca]|jgi:MarR family transcriptional regulator for hemolysin|uniref:MarR family transcriptional regulator n=2 Tax=Sphingomonas aurantiaca TaxID=185949 RepID=A0A2T5GLR3_9SPHN|nr:MarR family transcriptional regulator [Sphingomonas aurantiaca]PTQ60260.1 MarR family transcriptional regulator [Sphingomonas aurantiaca]
MTSPRRSLESSYARTLLPLAKMWRRAADRALSDMNVSASIGWALVQVSRLGDDIRQTDLASELDVTQASLVRSIDQMTAAGLVERHRDPADARVSRIRLTAHGRTLVTTIEAKFGTLRHEMLEGVSDEDLGVALRVAQQLAARFVADRAR